MPLIKQGSVALKQKKEKKKDEWLVTGSLTKIATLLTDARPT
jgi:hypothetical protein